MSKLLLVNDERLFLELERSFLRRETCQVYTASTAAEAIERARRYRPDVVLLDVSIPRMDGLEVCTTLKSDAALRSIPVLLLTTGRDESVAREAGADGTIPKPITRKKVLEAFRRFLPDAERVAERRAVRLPVTCTVGGRPVRTHSRDLSFTGMFVTASDPRPVGTQVDVRFRLPRVGGGPVAVRAEVVRAVPADAEAHRVPGMGLRFVDLPAAEKARINRFVREPEQRASTGDPP